MKDYTSEELLEWMELQNSDPEVAREAFAEFHRRYKEVIWKMSCRLAADAGHGADNSFAMDIFNTVLQKIYYGQIRTAKFDAQKVRNKKDPVKAWIFGIAKYALLEFLKPLPKQPEFLPQSEFSEEPRPFFDTEGIALSPAYSVKLSDVNNALAKLSKKERVLVLLSAQFKEQKSIPIELKRKFCQDYKLSLNSLTKTRQRAVEKLLKILKQYRSDVPDKITIHAS